MVTKRRMLDVKCGTSPLISVLTEVYLERGLFAGCIRYSISIARKMMGKKNSKNSKPIFTDFVIGNGVIISTSFGFSGYYSYLDRIKNPKQKPNELFEDNELGICHILPTFATRCMGEKVNHKEMIPIRYTVPMNSTIDMTILREANIRLYGNCPSF